MPLVFVHGVTVRKENGYEENVKERDGYFRDIALQGVPGIARPLEVTILNPFWGDAAAHFYWNHACLPTAHVEAFGGEDAAFAEIIAETAPDIDLTGENFLLPLARESLPRAVDCLWAAATFVPTSADDVAALMAAGARAAAYAEANPSPNWLQDVTDDDDLVETLLAELDRWQQGPAPRTESFGTAGDVYNRLKGAVIKLGESAKELGAEAAKLVKDLGVAAGRTATELGSAAARVVINPIVGAVRPWLHRKFSLFLGDVFAYLDLRDKKGADSPIIRTVAGALREAHGKRAPGKDEPLIVVAHSMGGNISYDVLSHFLTEQDVQVDLFLTVGSQVGLFEELKLFRGSDRSVPHPGKKLVSLPPTIKRWLNVYDPADSLGYAVAAIFEGASDFAFSTQSSALSAHGMYFYRRHFHERLNARLRKELSR